ncbi:unnamed protein product [Adineta steineri]|uniref:Uncharacterized protein n=1 Tax=Adineta steineri TaxID=433720 RepID=A0A818TL56_9BILA|nr:unnamed protein product [Adineta steineri]CAF3686241.1 unnamed protein product [Adineta steineri]
MAAAAYSTLPNNGYAGYNPEGDPYNTNNAGAYDTGFGAIASDPYQYPTNEYDNDIPDDQQQPDYSNEYQQPPYANENYPPQQPQNVLPNTYPPQPQNVPSNTYPPQPQNVHPQAYVQPPQNIPPQPYGQRPPNNQQQQPFYQDEHQQVPHTNGNYPPQQPQKAPSNGYPQQPQKAPSNGYPQQPPNHQQQPFYGNDHQQSPYDNDDYPPQQPPPPQNYPPNPFAQRPLNNQQQQPQFNGHPNPQVPKTNNRSMPMNNNTTESYSDISGIQPPYNPNVDNQYADPRNYQQNFAATKQHQPLPPVDNQNYQSPPYHNQPKQQMSNRPPKQEQQQYYQPPSPPESDHQQNSKPYASHGSVRRPSLSNQNNNYPFEPLPKVNHNRQDSKTSKSSSIPPITNKKKDETREEKQNKPTVTKPKSQTIGLQTEEPRILDKNKRNQKQPFTKNKRDNDSQSDDDDQHDHIRTNRNKKQPHTKSKPLKNYNYPTTDDYSSDDDRPCPHCRHQKKVTGSDRHLDKNPRLPPLRRLGKPSHQESHTSNPMNSKRTATRRFSQHDKSPSFGIVSSRQGNLYINRNTGHTPRYREAYDPQSDQEKSNGKSKRRQNSNIYEDEEEEENPKTNRSRFGKFKNSVKNHGSRKCPHACEKCGHLPPSVGRRSASNDGHGTNRHNNKDQSKSKSKYKSSTVDIPFSQPPIRADTYVESERIRAVRDAQGYYMPYKPYTLKDYNELKKTFNHNNLYSTRQESPVDRVELFKKGQEYGTFIEKSVIDSSDMQPSPPKEMPPVKPWHGGISGLPSSEEAAKRERALEYAKIQVRKYQETTYPRNRSHKSAPEQYGYKPLSKLNGHDPQLRICSICNGVCVKQNSVGHHHHHHH